MTEPKKDYFELGDGQIQVSIHDDTSVHIKALTSFQDPVELSAEEARELGELLLRLADRAS